jgi:benzoyl-CoA reductase/2-hydroxyglutaryl-CoA dehydratase subunit BcrC/BadD/HgdB
MNRHTRAHTLFFEDLLNDPLNHLVEASIDKGKIPIGYTCSYVPEVLLSVDPLIPIRIRAPHVLSTEIADIYLSSVICSYTRSVLEMAMDDQYSFLKGWIFAASCDHMRRLYDNMKYLNQPELIHILDVPHRQGKVSLSWYTDELKMLLDNISSHHQIGFTQAALSQAIQDHNEFSALLTSIGDLRKLKNPPLSGTEFQAILLASLVAPRQSLLPKIQEIKEALSGQEGISDYRARLLIVGGQLDNLGYIKIIESTGGLVVADHLCTGSIPGLAPIRMDEEPVQAIAAHYLNRISCPRMMEAFDSRVDDIMKSIKEYRIDGVVIEFIKFCDTWGIESSLLASALRKKGVPVLCLEREYQLTGEGQIKTRVQAFIESMGK